MAFLNVNHTRSVGGELYIQGQMIELFLYQILSGRLEEDIKTATKKHNDFLRELKLPLLPE